MFTLLLILSVLVAIGVFYQLRLTALTLANDADCGYTEHVHTQECIQKTLICELPETRHVHSAENGCYTETSVLSCEIPEHTHDTETCYALQVVYDCTQEHEHTADCPSHEESVLTCEQAEHTHDPETCFTTQQTLICTVKENAEGHVHGDECYQTEYVCGFAADYEHVHTPDCYSDDTADVETAAVWEATLRDAELTGEWPADLVAIAKTQLGYAESTANWRVDEEHNKKGYTRYGAWYGYAYGDWCAMFVSFCMNYAGIPEDVIPQGAGCDSWITALEQEEMYYETERYTPQVGDIVFFDWDADGSSDHVGIVESIDENGGITTIEGNTSDSVAYRSYESGDASIMGYCPVGEIYAAFAESNMLMTANSTTKAIGYSRIDPEGNPDWDGNQTEGAYADVFYNESTGKWEYKAPEDEQEFVFARITPMGNISTREYYVVNYDTYISMMSSIDLSTKAGQTALEKASQVAYCYNKTMAPPPRYDSYPYYGATDSFPADYTVTTNVSDSLFAASATSHREMTDKELREKITSIALNGYPYNRSGIQQTYHLTDGQFRALTQYAIWYYTDSIEVRFDIQGTNYYAGVFDKNGQKLTDTTEDYPDTATKDIYDAWMALIGSSVQFSESESAYVNLYTTSSLGKAEGTGNYGQYQNLLTVGLSDVEEEKTSDGAAVRIQAQKTMNEEIPAEGAFEFKLYTKQGDTYTEVFPDAYSNDQYGNVTFPALTFDSAGEYTYYVKEVAGGDAGIEYDTGYKEVKVQVSVATSTVTEFETSTLYGYETGIFDPGLASRYVRVNGQSYAAYCINASGGTAHGEYGYILAPTTEMLADEARGNRYGNDMAEYLRRVVYYFRDKKVDDTLTYTFNGETKTLTLNQAVSSEIVWYITGHEMKFDATMKNLGIESEDQLKAIIKAVYDEAGKTITDDYKLVLLTGQDTDGWGQQPIVIGLDTKTVTVQETSTSTETSYTAVQVNTPVIENKTKVSGNSLELTKQVGGSEGDKSKLFSFTVNLWMLDENGNKTSEGVAGDLAVVLSGGATAENNNLTDGKASFGTSGDASGTYAWHIFKLAHGQGVTITNLPDDVYYEIVETDYSGEGYTTTVGGVEGNTAAGSISGSATVTAAYRNTKGGSGYSAQIKATKTVDDLAPGKDQIFTFDLYDSDGTWIAEAKNDEEGNIVFPTQTYDKPGVYTYTIRERVGDPTKYTYAGEQTVTVTIGTNTELSKVLSAAEIKGVTGSNSTSGGHTMLKAQLTYDDGTTEDIDVWCIDATKNFKALGYSYETNTAPSVSDIAAGTTSGTEYPQKYDKTSISDTVNIKDALRKAVYWLPKLLKENGTQNDQGQYTLYLDLTSYGYTGPYASLGYSEYTLSMDVIQHYIWWLTGASYSEAQSDTDSFEKAFPALFKYLEDQGDPPAEFQLVLFEPQKKGSDDNGQPIVAGYTLSVDSSDDITVSEASFNNQAKPASYDVTLTAKKTLGGEAPGADDVFTFRLLDENLKEIQRTTNNGGEVKFYLNLTAAKTYTFYIEEVKGDNTGIRYDTTRHVYTVTVKRGGSTSSVLNEVIQAGTVQIKNSAGFYAVSGTGVTAHYAYPLYDGSTTSAPGSAGLTYSVTDTDVTNADLADRMTSNSYGENLLSTMRKVLYCFSKKGTSDEMGGYPLNSSMRNYVMQYLCGALSQSSSYYARCEKVVAQILQDYPDDPGGELAIFTVSGYVPMIAYYEPDGEAEAGTVEVTYNGAPLSDTNQPVIANRRATGRTLPGTGGPGMIPHVVIGIALMTGTVLYSGYRLRHKRERRFK